MSLRDVGDLSQANSWWVARLRFEVRVPDTNWPWVAVS